MLLARQTNKQYDLFENVTSSDHRPVALAMELMVRKDVIGFDRVRLPSPDDDVADDDDEPEPVPFHVQAALCVCEIAMSGLKATLLKQSAQAQIGEARFLYPSLGEDPLKGQRKVRHVCLPGVGFLV